MNDPDKVQQSWNDVYSKGNKYKDEPPIGFTHVINSTLRDKKLFRGKGLYIGCGNGRNYIPLIDEGLDIIGLDISNIALQQIVKRKPALKDKLICSPLQQYNPDNTFDFIIAIQVFQHGDFQEVQNNLKKVVDLLKPGGLFFFRNRAVGTPIHNTYELLEKTDFGGFTIKYVAGSKKGLEVHFLSEGEINELPKIGLTPIVQPYLVTSHKEAQNSKETTHWEGVWIKS